MSQLDVSIMGQAFKLSCKAGEEAELHQAVRYLDERMCAIRDAGKVKGNDRIAVIAALGIAAELLSTKAPDGPLSDMTMAAVREKIGVMHAVLDAALTPQENLF
ncbi:MAG: cell division protein ZapA [Herminiimonas sp.]|nr:cell division protein ZapA [Herminiimonas sp.]